MRSHVIAALFALGLVVVPIHRFNGPTTVEDPVDFPRSPDAVITATSDPCAHVETMTIQWFCTLDLEWPTEEKDDED